MSLEVNDIHFSYGPIAALAGVSLKLEGGAVGLLGPNGAGKSTLLRILLGFLTPSKGEGRVLGYDIRTERALIRRSVGYMPEDDCFIVGMDAVSFTSYFGELSGMPRQEAMKRAHEVLFYVGLGESRYRLLDTYSAGMKQRLKLAQALVHDPKLLFLDEPTSNLDPHGRQEILELIRDISSAKDIQVLVSSHILADIETLCADVVILNKGQVAAQGSSGEPPGDRLQPVRGPRQGRRESFPGRSRELGDAASTRPRTASSRSICPPTRTGWRSSGRPLRPGSQVRHFVKSRTSLEDLFARTVGVD